MATGSAPEQEQFNDAVVTARNSSGQLDQPAWVYIDPEYVPGEYLSKYQVACMDWTALAEEQQRAVVAVILPTGQEFVQPSHGFLLGQPDPEPWQVTRTRWFDVAAAESARERRERGIFAHKPAEAGGLEYLRYMGNHGAIEAIGGYHRLEVGRALRLGLPVPAAVLADYPDLAASEQEEVRR